MKAGIWINSIPTKNAIRQATLDGKIYNKIETHKLDITDHNSANVSWRKRIWIGMQEVAMF